MSAEAASSPANPGKPSRWTMPPWLAAWAMPAVIVGAFGVLLMVVLMEFHSLHVEIQDLRTESLAANRELRAAMGRINARIDETNASVRETNKRIDETNVRIDGLYERLPPPG